MQTLLLLDLDGTLIDTQHYEAWRSAARRVWTEDLTHEEYFMHMAGRTRQDGASRLIELKQCSVRIGARCSHDADLLAEIKQSEFMRLSANARIFDDALRLLARVEWSQQQVKFYTASENAPRIFEAALRRSGIHCAGRAVLQQRRDQTRKEFILSLVGEHPYEAVVLIDDAPHAVDVACSLGIRAYQIRRNAVQSTATHPTAGIVSSLDDITLPIRGL
ncbi:beta-phosphoglucomutase-like phosphatase (HAD superfamily) [Trinickia symbiotica]|uniref:hypothetical protein n=1 Tax=Trinickia symbiotica TaxID=863227 RepID=UPI00037017E9|nr:hypothetical protein [Trinickia symbiotica]PPK46737.1 beta-phosphoglucomutase-like phosphatase (HAD superfamily) [Trinickia symbiotica]